MSQLTAVPGFWLAATLFLFIGSRTLQERYKKVWLNPVLISVSVLIILLKLTRSSPALYSIMAGSHILFWMKPAVVALGLPLYRYRHEIRRDWLKLLLTQLFSAALAVSSGVLFAKWLGASPALWHAMATKSVTAPITLEITRVTGAIPELAVTLVVIVGIFGAVIGWELLEKLKITGSIERGLAIGAAAHALGTARTQEKDPKAAAFGTIALILNGLFTALIAPFILKLL